MRVFKEQQVFRQWWLWLILGSTLIVTMLPLFKNGRIQYENLEFLGIIPASLIILLFVFIKLETTIDSQGINVRFTHTGIFKRHYNWNEISDCYVRKYSPISEFGGWGVRGSGDTKAYNVSGNMGIQIITKDQKKFLIGTNKPEKAAMVIIRYQEKFKLI